MTQDKSLTSGRQRFDFSFSFHHENWCGGEGAKDCSEGRVLYGIQLVLEVLRCIVPDLASKVQDRTDEAFVQDEESGSVGTPRGTSDFSKVEASLCLVRDVVKVCGP